MYTCKHCGENIRNGSSTVYMTGNHPVLWVHDLGGFSICDPQWKDSPRAEPQNTTDTMLNTSK